MRKARIAMVQMNPIVGDLQGNVSAMAGWVRKARLAEADIVVFPELVITGYPPEDLVLRPSFIQDTHKALEQFVKHCRNLTVIAGFVEGKVGKVTKSVAHLADSSESRQLFNAAAVIQNGKILTTCHKSLLPNYGVFDESRYFHPGRQALISVIDGIRVGINICEDIWYSDGPTRDQVGRGHAELIININASPFHKGKSAIREEMLSQRARDNGVIVSYTNMVGGQDEIVFDGNSLLVDKRGRVMARAKAFEEDLLVADLEFESSTLRPHAEKSSASRRLVSRYSLKKVVANRVLKPKAKKSIQSEMISRIDPLEEVYRALVTGVRDYVRKNHFSRVVIGVSGGIDSALTALIAVDALGSDNVTGVFMPSVFTSRESREDSRSLTKALGCSLVTIRISSVWKQYLQLLAPIFKGKPHDATEENLQARMRGNLLMALSNKFGYLVLTTGNKSEMSVGYATLYGDMAGGFAVIKDVPKMLVYELARFRNRCSSEQLGKNLIPPRIIERAPSAELKPNQLDQDSLPPYEDLDQILEAYVEEDRSLDEIVKLGMKPQIVRKVMALVDRSEYKRRQAPIGIKITPRALGKDRRMPLTNRYIKY